MQSKRKAVEEITLDSDGDGAEQTENIVENGCQEQSNASATVSVRPGQPLNLAVLLNVSFLNNNLVIFFFSSISRLFSE